MSQANQQSNSSAKSHRMPRRAAAVVSTPRVTREKRFHTNADGDFPLFQVCTGVPVERAQEFASLIFISVHKALLLLSADGDSDGDTAFGLVMQLELGMAAFDASKERR